MKYADLLFLKGHFEASLEITERLLNSTSITLGDQIELMRIKGHIFRFQLKYEQAKVIYLTALQLVEKKSLNAYLGKLMTNLAEVEAFVNPYESISWFKKACDINEKSGNLIELVKAYSACAIANACIAKQNPDVAEKHIYEAISCANQAISLAKQSGYRAGEAFALVGLALANKNNNASEY